MATNKSQSRAKAQHYVPRLHLQHFRGHSPKNMIWTYSKSRETARPSRIEETGLQKNYYSLLDDSGSYNDTIDQMLQEIESKAAEPYRSLLAGNIPHGQERANFAVFIASCFSRSPALIRSYAESMARMMQLELRLNARDLVSFNRLADSMERDTGEKINNREEAFEFLNDPSRYTLGVSEKLGLRAIGIADSIAPLLFERPWNIVIAIGDRFITSDNPVYRWVPRDSVHPFYGDGGFKNPRAEVSFPLSTKSMLIIGGDFDEERSIFASAENVQSLNRMRAANAEEFLFADRKDDQISALAREYKSERPRMAIGHELAQDVDVDIKR
ncbi:DUF4238 domain-containing protein [uncultured Sphingomonas sp.]|uniref:DUF4238 domain-containing protein n=1 Tax=uncultured Sphingomonas sp. TaxID=158754 RepID=UPI0025D32C1A|nr:DUF4238 domain-containing protein [uncultured Sphingomonas sp.]